MKRTTTNEALARRLGFLGMRLSARPPFVRWPAHKVHPVLDLEAYRAHRPDWPLATNLSCITGPEDVHAMETVLATLDYAVSAATSRPVHVFIWALGEAPRRSMTKIGGLPYLPRTEAWPRSRRGEALVFLGQLSFLDSTAIVRGLPGDVLLMFMGRKRVSSSEWVPQACDCVFKWVRYSPGLKVVDEEDVPEDVPDGPPLQAYGVLHESREYGLYPAEILARVDVLDAPFCEWPIWPATKIGGFFNLAAAEGVERTTVRKRAYCVVGVDRGPEGSRFIAQFGSVQATGCGWVFANAEVVDKREPHMRRRLVEPSLQLMWGDCGWLALFVTEAGRIRCHHFTY